MPAMKSPICAAPLPVAELKTRVTSSLYAGPDPSVEQTVGTTILVAVGTPPPASDLLIGSTAIKITAIGDNDRDCANSQV
jgi:hypothetical protein